MTLGNEVVQRIKLALPVRDAYPLHEPLFGKEEEDLVLDCIKSGWVSSVGKYVDEFEYKLAEYTGIKKAIAVSNGTAALHICYYLAGVGAGDEVLCPSITFVATANAIKYLGATPHFVDCEAETLGVCPQKLREYLRKNYSKKIKALVVTHIFGHPAKLNEIRAICDEYGIVMIEDVAEALGSFYKGKHVGNVGHFAALSFNGNKIITTGGGGAVLTNDEAMGVKAKHITTTAKIPHQYEYIHDELGFNYRLPNLNAALGVAQLKKMDNFLKAKRELLEKYKAAFKSFEGAKIMEEPANCKSNYWLHTLILDKAGKNEILEAANKQKIFCRPLWKPMHQLAHFANSPKANLAVSEDLYERVINLPSSVGLV